MTKQLDLAAAQLYAVAGLFGHPLRLWRGQAAPGRVAQRRATRRSRTFIPPGRTLSQLAENIAGLVSSGPPQASGGTHQAASEEPEDEQFVDAQSVVRRIIANPGVQLFVALAVIALVAERRLLGTSPLGGGALVPAWGSASRLWARVPGGLPRGRRGLDRFRAAVPGGRGRAGHGARRPGVARGRRPAARLRAACRADRVPGHPAARHGDGRPGAAGGVLCAAPRRDRRRRRGPPRHRGRLRGAAADRDERGQDGDRPAAPGAPCRVGDRAAR